MRKVAIVYDRVNKWGGAERVLLALHEIFPEAPLYTSVYDSKKASWAKVFPAVRTSFLQHLPFVNSKHEMFGWLMPLAFETLDFSGFDLVISVTSEAAKGIITKPPTKHLCYCLTPTRYLWSDYQFYLHHPQKPLKYFPFYKFISKPFLLYLRFWDKIAAQRPDRMIAISQAVQDRINTYYGREAGVVYPPVKVDKLKSKTESLKEGNCFLVVSRLVPYKRVDLAVRAFNQLGYPLVIIGTGSEENKLKKMAKSNITFVKNLTDEELAGYYQYARALVMPQAEDFGLAAVEAQSCGVPVMAFNQGGAKETVVKGKTGLFFGCQRVEDLVGGIKKFEDMSFDKEIIIKNAKRFSENSFRKKILGLTGKI